MSQLIVALPLEALTAETTLAFVLVVDGQAVEAGECLPAQLPQPDLPGHENVALAPVRALSWHQVRLPEGVGQGSPRLKAVLDGLLEDQLLDEPGQLHFALVPDAMTASRCQWVAACDRRWLAMAVQGLAAAGRPLARVLPEWGPPGEHRLHVTGEAAAPWVVACSPLSVSVLALTPETLAWVLPAEHAQPDTTGGELTAPQEPIALQLSAEPELVALAEQQLQRPVQGWLRHERWQQAASAPWDLARGLLMRKRAQRAGIEWLRAPRWRLARGAVVSLLLVNLVGLNVLAWRQERQLAQARADMQRVLLQTFPQVRTVLDAPAQMQREVQRLAVATAAPLPTDLDAMLSALQGALEEASSTRAAAPDPAPNAAAGTAPGPGTERNATSGPAGSTASAPVAPPATSAVLALSSLSYRSGELRVTGLDMPAAQRDQLLLQLRRLGYQASQDADAMVLKVPT